jgi:hypothetical protein
VASGKGRSAHYADKVLWNLLAPIFKGFQISEISEISGKGFAFQIIGSPDQEITRFFSIPVRLC